MDHPMELVKINLVPIEVFGADDGYGLCDAVSSWSDCNRAYGHIYRRDEDRSTRDPDDVITVFVPQSELPKFDKFYGDNAPEELGAERDELCRKIDELQKLANDLSGKLRDRDIEARFSTNQIVR